MKSCWRFVATRIGMMFALICSSNYAQASDPTAVWDGNFKDADSEGRVVLENGYSLSINGNDVANDGASITIGEESGIYVDWVDTRKTVTVLLLCSAMPPVSDSTAIAAFWDTSTRSDLVGVGYGADGFAFGIWQDAVWSGNDIMEPAIGTTAITSRPSGVLAVRYDGGTGYVDSTVGGTALFSVNTNDWTIAEVYSDGNLKRKAAQFGGITIGACKKATSFLPLTGMEIFGVAVYDEYLSEEDIVEASTIFGSGSTSVSRVSTPQILPIDTVFNNAFQEVSITCPTEGATIVYTTDGSDPALSGREYTQPFIIYKSCVVRALAVKDECKNSRVATATFTRAEGLSEAANMYGNLMETDEEHPWTGVTDVSHDGVSSARSGNIGNNGITYLQTSVKKAGTVSFWWQAACEEADEEYYDYGAFSVDGEIVARIAGHDGEWHYVSHEITSGGKHVLKWEYSKDSIDSYSPDCIWVDQVQWVPADDSGYTLTTPEQVPYSWLTKYGFDGKEIDFETVAGTLSGKAQGGKATRLWEEFVAGTNPTNETSVFTAKIDMQEGVPVVTWEPNLNTNTIERLYKVYGKETLSSTEEWAYPTNSLHRFFKVTVEMP